jgi:hypothetical protein
VRKGTRMRPHSERAAAALRAMDACVKRIDEIARQRGPSDPVDLRQLREMILRRNNQNFRATRRRRDEP